MSDTATITSDPSASQSTRAPPDSLALVIAWSPPERGRIGEACIVPSAREGTTFVLGRGSREADDPGPRLDFVRSRAGIFEPRAPLGSPRLSRVQLLVRAEGTRTLHVQNVGRCPLFHDGAPATSAVVSPGSTLRLGNDLLLVCVRRPAWLPSSAREPSSMPFGRPDAHGIVGESAVAWGLRRDIAFVASRTEHVLITGQSGSGKELVARAVHALSPRAGKPLVARNAATFPEGIIDTELFGHARNYPNAGMPERPGLVAQADGATLFLDEVAELPSALQPHLLRVLDRGEYQRLGDGTVRTSSFRLVAATNRPDGLRDDLRARFKLSLTVPGLNERIEDVPHLVVHTLRTLAATNTDLASRLFPDGDLEAEPRASIGFIDSLVRREYRTHVRELEALLWEALKEGPEDILDGPRHPPSFSPPPSLATPHGVSPDRVTGADIEAALAANGGSMERTWRALGLASRHVLTRLIRKHGLAKKTEE